MSLAIAYAMKKRGHKMARGGMCQHGKSSCEMCHGGEYAKGGMVEEEEQSGYMSHPEEHEKMDHKAMMESDRMLNQHGMDEMAADDMDEDNEPQHERMVSHPVENQDDHEDMVGRIMKHRQQHYSEGGRVANKTSKSAEFEPNQFDDLVNRDDLEEHYTGKNSGDELGNAQEDEDRADIVARIMKQRRMKDRNPHPA